MPDNNARHLQDIILGGQDGLVNVLGLTIGVAGATSNPALVLLAGIAAGFAESISMGAVAYTSTQAGNDFQKKHAADSGIGKGEIESILSRLKRLPPKRLAFVRYRLLMHEDGEEGAANPLSKAAKVMFSTMAGSLLPLLPYLLLPVLQAAAASIVLSALVLFITGALKAAWTAGEWKRSGFEMLLFGMLAAAAGYGVGVLLRVPA